MTQSYDEKIAVARGILGKGNIHFWKDSASKVKGIPYIRVALDVSPDDVTYVMLNEWNFKLPRIVLNVINNYASSIAEWKNQRLLETFKNGLVTAMNATSMWLFTNGVNAGITKEIGKAIAKEKQKRKILNCRRHNHIDAKNQPPIKLIGIVREDVLYYADKFEATRNGNVYLENTGCRLEEDLFELNPDHTHFIIVRDESSSKTGLDHFLLKFEYALARTSETLNLDDTRHRNLSATEVPLLVIFAQGGSRCSKLMLNHLQKQLPIIILEGSGGMVDLVAYAHTELNRRGLNIWDADFVESLLKPEINFRVSQFFPKYRETHLSLTYFRDQVIEITRFASQEQNSLFFTVLTPSDQESQNFTDTLLDALFKTQFGYPQWDRQVKKELLLTMDWNCPHVASKKVFGRDTQKYKVSKDDFEYALLQPNREEFLDLFLKKGFQVHKYLSPNRLRQLFFKAYEEDFFHNVCWEEILCHNPTAPMEKTFLEQELNWLIETTTGLQNYVDTQELAMNTAMGMYISDSLSAERKSLAILCLWAVFTNRRKMAEVLWKNCDQPIHLALVVSQSYTRLSAFVSEGTTKKDLLESRKHFSNLAYGVLDTSFKSSSCRAYDILNVKTHDWKHKTAVDIAAIANNMQFLSHPCCQRWLTNQFMGCISIRETNLAGYNIPHWITIQLCAFLAIPTPFLIRFRQDPHQVEELTGRHDTIQSEQLGNVNTMEKLRHIMSIDVSGNLDGETDIRHRLSLQKMVFYLWTAPITKFYIYQTFYMLFLFLLCLAALKPSCGEKTLDTLICIWMFLLGAEILERNRRMKKIHGNVQNGNFQASVALCFSAMLFFTRICSLDFIHSPFYAKVTLCLAINYFFFQYIATYHPISPTLGPLLYAVKFMIVRDFKNFMILTVVVMISGGIAVHTIIYPDYPLGLELIRRIMHRSFFSLFLTPSDDLYVRPECITKMYKPLNSKPSCTVSYYIDHECPVPGLWPYIFIIAFFLCLKLILLTLLYALFFNTQSEQESNSDAIWRFQRYHLVNDFAARKSLPPPLNVFELLKALLRLIRKRKNEERTRKSKQHFTPFMAAIKKAEKQYNLSENDYLYWKQMAMDYSEKQKEKAKDLTKESRYFSKIMYDDINNQTELLDTMSGQLLEVQRKLGHTLSYLETLKQLNKENDQQAKISNNPVMHLTARTSPYPSTRLVRFPVPDKYVSWDITWLDYDPVAYTKPKTDFPNALQEFVDPDILLISQQPALFQAMPQFKWNTAFTSPAGVSIDRTSWILEKNSANTIYKLENEGVPRNPMGRTGLRGRGALPRWGPNHYVLFIISRQTTQTAPAPFTIVPSMPLEIVLVKQVNAINYHLPGGFAPGENVYDAVLKNIFQVPESQTFSTKEDVVAFFNSFITKNDKTLLKSSSSPKPTTLPIPSTSTTQNISSATAPIVEATVIKRGYLDSAYNTDNAWREIELWKVHYPCVESIATVMKDNVMWKACTEELLNHMPIGEANLLIEAHAIKPLNASALYH